MYPGVRAEQAADQLPVRTLAQDEPASPAEEAESVEESVPEAAFPVVAEAKPDLLYVLDKDGSLKLLLGWTMEQLEELVKLKNGVEAADRPPPYAIESVDIDGRVIDDRAELTIAIEFRVTDSPAVRIPLRLDQIVVRQEPESSGPGEVLLLPDAAGTGYVLYYRNDGANGDDEDDAGSRHTLRIEAWARVVRVGDENRLRLSVPNATTSTLHLTVPERDATGTVTQGSSMVRSTTGEEGTTFEVAGVGEGFELVWRAPKQESASTRPVLDATAETVVKVGSTAVDYETRLIARSYGGPFDRFRVRLPEQADLIPITSTQYDLEVVSEKSGSDKDVSTPERRVVEVRLPEPTLGPVEVRLAARRTESLMETGGWIELAGFEVPEAIRQSGFVGVMVVGDRLLVWGPSQGVRQVEELPNWQQEEELVAGFEYFGQPYSLTARVLPRATRITVTPDYRLDVSADQSTLSGTLKLDVRGAPATSIEIEIGDWVLDDLGPINLVAAEGVQADGGGVVTVPLLERASGELELSIRAHREHSSGELTVALPQLRDAAVNDGRLSVVPADNIELTPDPDKVKGLVRLSGIAAWNASQGKPAGLTYRLEGPQAVFAANIVVHRQKIVTEVAAEVDLSHDKALVEERIRYDIAYVPRDKALAVELPEALAASRDLAVSINGEAVSLLRDAADEPSARAGWVVRRIPLSQPLLGRMEVVFRYPLAPPETSRRASAPWTIDLVRPLDGTPAGQTLTITSPAGIDIPACEVPWEVTLPSKVGADGICTTTLTTLESVASAKVSVRLWDAAGVDSVIVDRALIETWMDRSVRQDRVVYRITTRQASLEVRLPSEASLETAQVFLDGRPVQVEASVGGLLMVPLHAARHAENGEPRSYLLEIWYSGPRPASRWGRSRLALPQIGPNAYVRRVYWRIAIPGDEHIITNFGTMTPEYRWGWARGYWGRIPTLTEQELADWIGCAAVGTPGDREASRYLFGGLQQPAGMDVWILRRTWIVGGASLVVLLLGLTLIYVPMMRRPATLMVLATACGALVFLSPAMAFLTSQAGSLGAGMVLLGFLLRRGLTRRTRVYMVPDTTAVVERGSTETMIGAGPPIDLTMTSSR
ncbi:hypothetical protein JCM19992_24860 [Thermostilla marina]